MAQDSMVQSDSEKAARASDVDREQLMHDRIDRDFVYHPPKGDQQRRYEELRTDFRMVAHRIVNMTPTSREQSLALTSLEEAVFWANAAIARNE